MKSEVEKSVAETMEARAPARLLVEGDGSTYFGYAFVPWNSIWSDAISSRDSYRVGFATREDPNRVVLGVLETVDGVRVLTYSPINQEVR